MYTLLVVVLLVTRVFCDDCYYFDDVGNLRLETNETSVVTETVYTKSVIYDRRQLIAIVTASLYDGRVAYDTLRFTNDMIEVEAGVTDFGSLCFVTSLYVKHDHVRVYLTGLTYNRKCEVWLYNHRNDEVLKRSGDCHLVHVTHTDDDYMTLQACIFVHKEEGYLTAYFARDALVL